MGKRIILCAGGPDPVLPPFDETIDYIIGVDKGALALVEAGFSLNYAVGDFDSVTSTELEKIKHHSKKFDSYPAEKDWTDFQLGLFHIVDNLIDIDNIEIYGALSGKGRIDHFIANLWIAHSPKIRQILSKMTYIESNHRVQFFLPGSYILPHKADFFYLSIIGLTPLKQLEIIGAKYELPPTDFVTPCSLISNEFHSSRQNIEISFREGILSVWYVAYDR